VGAQTGRSDTVSNVFAAVRSELLPTVIALVLVGAYVYLVIQEIQVPDGLEVLVGAVVAFYYQARNSERAASQAVAAVVNGATKEARSVDHDIPAVRG